MVFGVKMITCCSFSFIGTKFEEHKMKEKKAYALITELHIDSLSTLPSSTLKA